MRSSRFARYAWAVLAYNIAVVVWGAFVRATGSGAGCGSHWPLCNGVVVPQSMAVATMIELSHRVTSGLSLLLVVGLAVSAWRGYPRGHVVRRGAATSLFFIITEALIGAGLVLFELVAHDQSVARVWSHGAHLVNTFLLLGALTLTAWWASGRQRLRLRGQGSVPLLLGVGLVGMLLLGATGALTALGDTLFPAASLQAGMAQDFAASSHFLVRLRIVHPIIAIILGGYLVVVGRVISSLRPDPATRRWSHALAWLFGLQLLVGATNLRLLAPVWLQLIHLLMADLVWVALVLLSAAALAQQTVPESEIRVPTQRTTLHYNES